MRRRRWAAVAVGVVASAALAGDPVTGTRTELPREATWDGAVAGDFDPQWIVPETRTDPEARADRRPVDLAKRLIELSARRFPTPEGAEDDPRTASFADLIATCRAFGDDTDARGTFLGKLKRGRADVWNACGEELLQLGRDEFLRGGKWKPSKDDDRDGILHAKAFRIDCEGKEPWTKIDASRNCQQGATVFLADLEAIKTAENDYTAYPSNVGASYNHIWALPGTYLHGKDPKGRPFNTLRIDFQCDLPFPYSSYDCELHILNRVGDDGLVRSDIYTTTHDFYWMAGQDVFVPLTTVAGDFAGLVLVRVFGFDIRSVPDGDDDVREALRSSLGNLKLRSEKLFAASGAKPRTLKGSVPVVPVRGVR